MNWYKHLKATLLNIGIRTIVRCSTWVAHWKQPSRPYRPNKVTPLFIKRPKVPVQANDSDLQKKRRTYVGFLPGATAPFQNLDPLMQGIEQLNADDKKYLAIDRDSTVTQSIEEQTAVAYQYLVRQGYNAARGDRVILVGHSAGAMVAAKLMTLPHHLLKAEKYVAVCGALGKGNAFLSAGLAYLTKPLIKQQQAGRIKSKFDIASVSTLLQEPGIQDLFVAGSCLQATNHFLANTTLPTLLVGVKCSNLPQEDMALYFLDVAMKHYKPHDGLLSLKSQLATNIKNKHNCIERWVLPGEAVHEHVLFGLQLSSKECPAGFAHPEVIKKVAAFIK